MTILIICHSWRAEPRLETLQFEYKKKRSMEWAVVREMIKKAPKSVCTSTVVVSPNHLSPMPSTSAAIKTPGNTEDEPDDSEPAHERDNRMEYNSD
jgi:hypothetical protein